MDIWLFHVFNSVHYSIKRIQQNQFLFSNSCHSLNHTRPTSFGSNETIIQFCQCRWRKHELNWWILTCHKNDTIKHETCVASKAYPICILVVTSLLLMSSLFLSHACVQDDTEAIIETRGSIQGTPGAMVRQGIPTLWKWGSRSVDMMCIPEFTGDVGTHFSTNWNRNTEGHDNNKYFKINDTLFCWITIMFVIKTAYYIACFWCYSHRVHFTRILHAYQVRTRHHTLAWCDLPLFSIFQGFF